MKKPYQIAARRAVQRVRQWAEEKSPVVQLVLPMIEILTLAILAEYNAAPSAGNGNLPFTVTQVNNFATMTLAPPGTPLWHPQKDDFAPRLGVAWEPLPNLVLRAGAGIFYDLGYAEIANVASSFPYVQSKTILNTSFLLSAANAAPAPFTTALPVSYLAVVDPGCPRARFPALMPALNGIEAIIGIRSEFPHARIIVLTTYAGDVQVLRALKAGARGYILKAHVCRQLLDTIRTVHAGQKRIPPEVSAELAEHAAEDELSLREIDVLRLIAAGNANKEIAGQLAIAEETVKSHVTKILAKLGANDRTHAVTFALKRGIIEL